MVLWVMLSEYETIAAWLFMAGFLTHGWPCEENFILRNALKRSISMWMNAVFCPGRYTLNSHLLHTQTHSPTYIDADTEALKHTAKHGKNLLSNPSILIPFVFVC